MKIYAIIPARSGSRGVPDKNIRKIAGKELIGYSIDFAHSLEIVDRVLCSTDSKEYAAIAQRLGAEVPFLRSAYAATDTAMEEDILVDLNQNFNRCGIEKPDIIVWLRPTFLFRSKKLVDLCIERLIQDRKLTACRVVCEAEARIYMGENGLLKPLFDDHGASMIRRQDVRKAYKVFNTDVFWFPKRKVSKKFLGDRIGYEVADKICAFDIDDEIDFKIVEAVLTNSTELISQYLA